jgi:hypothetical protein
MDKTSYHLFAYNLGVFYRAWSSGELIIDRAIGKYLEIGSDETHRLECVLCH